MTLRLFKFVLTVYRRALHPSANDKSIMIHPNNLKPASIHDLPNEVLLLAFKFLYMTSRSPTDLSAAISEGFRRCTLEMDGDQKALYAFYEEPYETKWAKERDLFSPSLFPYSQANVCQRWRNVLGDCSVFWTRVVIPVDKCIPLTTILDYFCWSKDHLIEIFVGRGRTTSTGHLDSHERQRVATIMPFIALHFPSL
ncbi:hypothetical protein HYDPIDRAFT_115324 [Hydnomerulius pinastri MD-312]|uniref:F-box domain-containing protein n=1 Tax=Hydnomerulius pinastri MD-312 TaxID=994086 RepID=A0A0C9VUV0_9AGAM|nr:hypothetical protein HYDPIDRAFT_115324 [Hydnomerulius pinastri MD-312]